MQTETSECARLNIYKAPSDIYNRTRKNLTDGTVARIIFNNDKLTISDSSLYSYIVEDILQLYI